MRGNNPQTSKFENYLHSLKLNKTRGYKNIHQFNEKRWSDALIPFLISGEKLAQIIGSEDNYFCSFNCRREYSAKPEFKRIDGCRLKLSCGHFSRHLQCTLQGLIHRGKGDTYQLFCPIHDGKECKRASGKEPGGPFYYWGQRDYSAFVSAFLGNWKLVQTFLDEEKLAEFNLRN